ncbi:MAG: hypothetical protein RL758_920, partial [Pseudomonadota bacterium]
MSTAPARSKKFVWLAVIAALVLLVALYQHFDLGRWLTLDSLKSSRDGLQALYQERPVVVLLAYFGLYVLATALSFPGASVLTLAAGALFGFWLGLLLVSFASSLGALLAFLASRYLLRDAVQSRFARMLAPINEGVQKDGTFY